MSNLYISEFYGLGATAQSDSVAVPSALAWIDDQAVAISADAANSEPLNAKTQWIELSCDGGCSFTVTEPTEAGGDTPSTVATVDNQYLAAGQRVMRRVVGGMIVSAIANT
jgi:hypothetical protein